MLEYKVQRGNYTPVASSRKDNENLFHSKIKNNKVRLKQYAIIKNEVIYYTIL